MTRSPRDCIQAVLANLEMAKTAASVRRLKYQHGGAGDAARTQSGRYDAIEEAIALIRTECASFLTTETKESTHA